MTDGLPGDGVEKKKPAFAEALAAELYQRYLVCEDHAATPCNILLAVANAVAAAQEASK